MQTVAYSCSECGRTYRTSDTNVDTNPMLQPGYVCEKCRHNYIGSNGYRIGSLAWIEKNIANQYRTILESLISGDISKAEAERILWAMDTDTLQEG